MDDVQKIEQKDLVYIDESGVDLSICRERAWGRKGQVVYGKKSGQHYKRLNLIAGLVGKRPIAPLIFEGNCDTEFFNAWVEQFLIKALRPGQVVVLDNASFHKSRKTKELIESVGCRILFLPPYSPDFNPIEKFWAKTKRWVRSNIHSFSSLFLTLCSFFDVS